MNQNQINQEVWSNRENWSHFCYKSRKDSRMFVPKRWGFGWTVNFGNPKGVAMFVAMIAVSVLIAVIARHGGFGK